MRRDIGFALRLLRRDFRSGDLAVLAIAVIIAVSSAVSVTAFTDRLSRAIKASGSEALGADLVLSSSFESPVDYERAADERGLTTSRSTSLRSVVVAGENTALAEVKAVDERYPLRGSLRATPAIGEPDATRGTGPSRGTVWVDARLAALLDVRRGDTLYIGESALTLDSILTFEPDRGGEAFAIAPRTMMHYDDMDDTGLIQPGSRVRYRLMVKGTPEAVDAWRQQIEPQLDNASSLIDSGNAGPRLAMAVERGERFLSLAALVSILLAGAAIARSAQHYADRQLDAAALMRTVGAGQSRVVRLYLVVILIVAVVASLIGALAGLLGQQVLVQLLPGLAPGALPLPSLAPVGYGLVLGVLTVFAFAAPALIRLRRVPPLRVLKRDLGSARGSIIANYTAAFLLLAGFVFWLSRDIKLGLWLLAGTAATVLLLAGVSIAMIYVVRFANRRGGISWRYGLASLVRHRGAVIGQTTALGVGVMAMLLLTFVRADLLSLWEDRLPPQTPNHFLIGIKDEQREDVQRFASEQGLGEPHFAPIVRARLEAINGKTVSADDFEEAFAKRRLQRAANLSWYDAARDDNHIVEGRWWTPDDSDRLQVSVEQDYARALNFNVGDTLRYRVADQAVDLRVSSIRRVDWDSFRPNFFLVTPTGALPGVTPGYMASVYVDRNNATYLRQLVRTFPNITDIDVDAILAQVRLLMNRINRALQYLFLFTLAAGFTVLYATVVTTFRNRTREIGILKTLGARRSELNLALATEFGALGFVAGGVGAFAASLIGWTLGRYVLQLDYQIDPGLWLVGLIGGALLVGLVGVLNTRKVLHTPTWVSLRSVAD